MCDVRRGPRATLPRVLALSRALAALLAGAALTSPAASAAPGPPLREDPAALAASLECTPDVATSSRLPVILVHGTTSSPEESFSWGYRKVLPERGFPTCTVRLPGRATVDLQRAAEYVVYAIRTVAARSPAHRIDVLGHSQGAFHGVFTQKFWPDLPALTDDVVALSGPFKEAEGLQAGCNAAACSPPFRQRQKGSAFFGAFLAAPLPPGPSFTSVLTLQDEVTRPQPASSTLAPSPGADVRTIVLQDLCPGRTTEHLGMLGDAVVFQLVLDAFSHPGTADPARITPDCAADRFPGTDDRAYAMTLPSALANLAVAGATADRSPAEPPVRCYLRADCGDVAERGAMVTVARLGPRPRRRLRLEVAARGEVLVTVRAGTRTLAQVRRAVTPGRRVITLPRVRRRGTLGVTVATRPVPYATDLAERALRWR